MTDVTVTRRVVETAGKGLRGRDGERSALVPCTITGTNNLVLTPIAPSAVLGDGSTQIYFGRAAAASTGAMTVVVVGGNDGDPRQIRLPGGEQVPAGAIGAGEIVAVAPLASGQFELLWPALPRATPGFVTLTQSNASGNLLQFANPGLFVGEPQLLMHKVAHAQAEGGVTVEIAGSNTGDARQLRTPDGLSQIAPGTWAVGDTIFFRYNSVTGMFNLVLVARAESAAIGGGLSTYQQVALRGAAQNASALRIASLQE